MKKANEIKNTKAPRRVLQIQDQVLNRPYLFGFFIPSLMAGSGFLVNFAPKEVEDRNFFELLFVYLFELAEPYLLTVFLVLTVLYFIGKSLEMWAKPRLHDLQTELLETRKRNKHITDQLRIFFDGYLLTMSQQFDFGKRPENNERISLYVHERNQKFILFGRYSANPTYTKTRRTSYPDDQGCISRGWANHWHFDNSFPCPDANTDEYNKYCRKLYKIPIGVCKAIRMKSRCMAAMAIRLDGNSIAVLVLESTKKRRFLERDIKEKLNDRNDFLARTIHLFRDYIPNPQSAKDEEF